MTIKLHYKIGQMELSFEGETDFFEKHISKRIDFFESFMSDHPAASLAAKENPGNPEETSLGASKPKHRLALTSIASKLRVKTGPELILATAVYLTTQVDKPSFSRAELQSEMKNASGFYKKTHSSNFSKYLDTLVKSSALLEESSGNYCLSDEKLREMEGKIG